MRDLRSAVAPLPVPSEIQDLILARILRGSIAWQTLEELEVATGMDAQTIGDAVADLDATGWLDAWERDPDPVVTLSVAGAARLGARIVERGASMTPCWALAGEPEPPEPAAANVAHLARSGGLSTLPDPQPGPELLAMFHEEHLLSVPSRRPRRITAEILPWPTILLGTSLTPWPGPGAFRAGHCPACHSRPLGHSMYCLGCDRWGLDHLVGEDADALRKGEKDRDVEVLRRDRERRAMRRRSRFLSESECCRRKRGRNSRSSN